LGEEKRGGKGEEGKRGHLPNAGWLFSSIGLTNLHLVGVPFFLLPFFLLFLFVFLSLTIELFC